MFALFEQALSDKTLRSRLHLIKLLLLSLNHVQWYNEYKHILMEWRCLHKKISHNEISHDAITLVVRNRGVFPLLKLICCFVIFNSGCEQTSAKGLH